jgi:hypothetical protein
VEIAEKISDKNIEASTELENTILDLEMRSMRENLMFYGIKGGGKSENCEELINFFFKTQCYGSK